MKRFLLKVLVWGLTIVGFVFKVFGTFIGGSIVLYFLFKLNFGAMLLGGIIILIGNVPMKIMEYFDLSVYDF